MGMLLRRAVLELAEGENRRVFPPALHVGVPGGTVVTFGPADDVGLDAALRVEVVEAMVHRHRRMPDDPLVWLTRPGPPDTQDVDLRWLAATTTAAAELGTDLRLVVVDKRGWHDPRTGAGQRWRSLRDLRRSTARG